MEKHRKIRRVCRLCVKALDSRIGKAPWKDSTIRSRFLQGFSICPNGLDLIEDPEYYQVPEACFLKKYHTKELKEVEMFTLNEKGVTDYALGLQSSKTL